MSFRAGSNARAGERFAVPLCSDVPLKTEDIEEVAR